MLRILKLLDAGLEWLEKTILASCILIMAVLMSVSVLGSQFFGRGIPGTEEITRMLIIILTFVGVGYAARKARHITMSAVYDQLKGNARKTLLIIISAGTGALMFYLAYQALLYDIALFERGRTSSSLRIPWWIIDTALPLGFTLAGIQYLLTIVRNLTSDEIWRSFTEKEEYSDVPLDDDNA